ncbi:S-adenosyl-L-methionine-dependent methyltransferase [Pilobolus umbonatus]|nr:S-adenosyl-L-methionine-dependent methyltransferase [Pilobolus umbonatus]
MGNQPSKDRIQSSYNKSTSKTGKRPNNTKKKGKSCSNKSPNQSSLDVSDRHSSPRRSSSSSAIAQDIMRSSNSFTSEDEPNTPTINIPHRSDKYLISQSLPTSHSDSFVSKASSNTNTTAVENIRENNGAPPTPVMFNDMFSNHRIEERDKDRQTRQHYVLKQVFGGNLHVDPVNEDSRILESACGLGLWTIEMAQQYPNCEIIAIDKLLPSDRLKMNDDLPRRNTTGSIKFQYGNVLEPLAFPDNHFDLIYQREIGTSIAFDQWPNMLAEFYRTMKPGANIELVEHDLLFSNVGPILAYFNEWCLIAAESVNTIQCYSDYICGLLEDAGFINVEELLFEIPVGEWPEDDMQKQHGYLYKELVKTLFKSMRYAWSSGAGVTVGEFDAISQDAFNEFDEFHTTIRWRIFTATKPA